MFCSCMHVWDILSGNNRDQAFDLKNNETKIRSLELRISRNSLSSLTLTKMGKMSLIQFESRVTTKPRSLFWHSLIQASLACVWELLLCGVHSFCFLVVIITAQGRSDLLQLLKGFKTVALQRKYLSHYTVSLCYLTV